jgi:hypothetical protein
MVESPLSHDEGHDTRFGVKPPERLTDRVSRYEKLAA